MAIASAKAPLTPLLLKWGIFWQVLPLSGIFAVAKCAVHFLGWELWDFDALIAALLSAATFAIALLLSNTLADYRLSELLPMQLATSLETIADTSLTMTAAFPQYQSQPLRSALVEVGQATLAWLQQGGEFSAATAAIDRLNPLLAPILELGGTAPILSRLQGEQAKLRSILWQMQSIRDTDFLPPAYILLSLFLAGSSLSLLLIEMPHFSENLVVSDTIFTSLFYLLFLIRDLDNPFEYKGTSYVDVDLAILHSCIDRLRQLASD
jgi:hypothetical protein